ncbi:tetratricopeptide repeat protein [Phenylobacterium sp.]|uniref:tetratricopeptide repeat protein n=1 Tax=Phenylobacterium sp. TaxID=1871053 RepID=UPI003BAC5B14
MFRTVSMAGALALACVAGSAQAAVTVIGGGLAQACSQAAVGGESDVKFQKLCTDALDTEFMNARDRAGTLVNRGVLKLRRGAYPEATRDFDQAVKLKADMGEAYVNRGAASIGQRRYAESLPDLNKGLELGVQEPAKAYYNRALAYEGLDDAKSAYFDYQKALEMQPEWAAPREQLTRFSVSRR